MRQKEGGGQMQFFNMKSRENALQVFLVRTALRAQMQTVSNLSLLFIFLWSLQHVEEVHQFCNDAICDMLFAVLPRARAEI